MRRILFSYTWFCRWMAPNQSLENRQLHGTFVRSGRWFSGWRGRWESSLVGDRVETGRMAISGPWTKIAWFLLWHV